MPDFAWIEQALVNFVILNLHLLKKQTWVSWVTLLVKQPGSILDIFLMFIP